MSLDEMYMAKCREEQSRMDEHAELDYEAVKGMYRAGQINLVDAMELQIQTPEYKRLKGEE